MGDASEFERFLGFLNGLSPEQTVQLLGALENRKPREKRGFITPEYHAALPVELQSTRKGLTFVALPSGRYIARKTRDAYNALLTQQGSNPQNAIQLFNIEHNQYAEGELIPRIPESADGRDVFVFVSPYEPSYISDVLAAIRAARPNTAIDPAQSLESLLKEGSSGDPALDRVIAGALTPKLLNANLFEALTYIRTLHDNNAGRIIVVMPYLAYSRQNHPSRLMREATLTRAVIEHIFAAGAKGLISVDPHSDDTYGFTPSNTDFVMKMVDPSAWLREVFTPHLGPDVGFAYLDKGCVDRYQELVKFLGLQEIYISKVRRGKSKIVNITGLTPNIRKVLWADDIGATIKTGEDAEKLMYEQGVKEFIGALTHGLFTENAPERIHRLHQEYGLKELYITDTVPQPPWVRDCDFIHEQTMGKVLAKIINAVHYETSASQHTDFRVPNGNQP